MSKRTKFGFQIAGSFHAIVSVHENKNGEVIINPAFAENYSEIEFGNPNAKKRIRAQHYTVHHSPDLENENVLNHTLEFIDGSKANTRIYTRAFKRTGLFCPLMQARGQDFSAIRYKAKLKKEYEYVTLGSYTPSESTLYYMAIVSSRKDAFEDTWPDLHSRTVHFQKYSFTILWSYGLVPSHTTGNKLHFLTQKEYETQIKEGFSQREIITLYRLGRAIQHESFFSFLQKELPAQHNHLQFLKVLSFKKHPEPSLDEKDKALIAIYQGYESLSLAKKAQDGGHLEVALRLYEKSEQLFKAYGESIAYADTLNSKGIIFQLAGYYTKSIASYQESLEIYKQNELFLKVARTQLNLSIVHRDAGYLAPAIDRAQEVLKIATMHGFTSLLAETNKELAIIYKSLQDLKKSSYFLNVAISLYKEDHNLAGEAFCLGNMGLILAMQGMYSDSLKLHHQALEIFTALGHRLGMANEQANEGNLLCTLGNFELGMTQLNSALKEHTTIGYQYGIATDLKLIGAHLANKGAINEAKKSLEKSREILMKINNTREAAQITGVLNALGYLSLSF